MLCIFIQLEEVVTVAWYQEVQLQKVTGSKEMIELPS
jgi:hypothetical protein